MLLRLPLDDVDLAHPMWLVLRQELRERQVITGERVDAVEHHAPGNAVIPVGGVEVVRAVWTLGDDEVRPPLPDLTADVEPEAARVLELTIVVAEELNVFHAERARGLPLFCLTDAREAIPSHRAVARPHAAVRDDDVGDFRALLHELGDRAAGARFSVVRVSDDDEHALDAVYHWLLLKRSCYARLGSPASGSA